LRCSVAIYNASGTDAVSWTRTWTDGRKEREREGQGHGKLKFRSAAANGECPVRQGRISGRARGEGEDLEKVRWELLVANEISPSTAHLKSSSRRKGSNVMFYTYN
jgi:hypothetical protein